MALNSVPGAPDLGDSEDDDGGVLVAAAREVGLGEGHLLHRLPRTHLAGCVYLGKLEGQKAR